MQPSRQVEAEGFAIVPGVVPTGEVASLAAAIDAAGEGDAVLRRGGTLYGIRDALRGLPGVRRLAGSGAVLDLARAVLGPGAMPVRALLFDKTAGANWGVPWHQDLTIAVEKRVEADGFGPWTLKAGVYHVRPPAGVLERMVTLRVHLDDSGPEGGPLRVLPGSHLGGILGASAVRDRLERRRPVECLAVAGGVVMIRPLLLHASSPGDRPNPAPYRPSGICRRPAPRRPRLVRARPPARGLRR